MNSDMVIIGGGAAGLAAALGAHEKGIKALVLEKKGVLGGNGMLAEGFFAAESPAQRRLLIDANKDLLFRKALDYAHYKVNPRILRAFINKSGDTVRWVEEKGLRIERILPFYPNQVPLVWHIVEGHGATLMRLFEKECGAKAIPIRKKTPAQKILLDEQGRVKGVLAQDPAGEIEIETRCVLVATGGYAGNRNLLEKYCPQHVEMLQDEGLPGMEGDGLLMAMAAGADTDGLGNLQMVGPAPFPKNWALEGVSGEPNCLWVNVHGRRFIHETITFNVFEAVNAILRQKTRTCFAIIDETIKQEIMERGLVRGCGALFVPRGKKMDALDEEIQKQVQKGAAMVSSSLKEISAWIGASGEVLERTVQSYNRFCDNRYDESFLKDPRYLNALRTPPYYAIRFGGGILGTMGGIKINEKMEVLNSEEAPIPGLYAAGADTGGWESGTYNAVLSGTTFGFALNSGRIAAEQAAQYLGKLEMMNDENCA